MRLGVQVESSGRCEIVRVTPSCAGTYSYPCALPLKGSPGAASAHGENVSVQWLIGRDGALLPGRCLPRGTPAANFHVLRASKDRCAPAVSGGENVLRGPTFSQQNSGSAANRGQSPAGGGCIRGADRTPAPPRARRSHAVPILERHRTSEPSQVEPLIAADFPKPYFRSVEAFLLAGAGRGRKKTGSGGEREHMQTAKRKVAPPFPTSTPWPGCLW